MTARATTARGKAARKRSRRSAARRVRRMDHLQTPPGIIDQISRFRPIGLDAFGQAGTPASSAAATFWTSGAMQRRWDGHGLVFVQPPHSRGWLPAVAPKCEAEGDEVIALWPASVEAAWWQDHVIPAASAVCFLRGRVFYMLEGDWVRDKKGRATPAWFPSALVYYPASTDLAYARRFCEHFRELGTCLRLDGERRARQSRIPGS